MHVDIKVNCYLNLKLLLKEMIAWIEGILRKLPDLTNLTKLYNINKNAKKLQRNYQFCTEQKKCKKIEVYITIKYHKKKFSHQNSLPLDNNYIQKETFANQWKDTSPVIEWFVNIKEKEHSSFMDLILKVFTLQ